MNWQPIETAPKDGTLMLLFSPRDGVACGRWYEQKYDKWERVSHDTKKLTGVTDYSRFEGTSADGAEIGTPTHWMPLPAPPSPPPLGRPSRDRPSRR